LKNVSDIKVNDTSVKNYTRAEGPNESQIKMALMANRGVSEAAYEGYEHEYTAHRGVSLSGYSQIYKNQRRVERLLESGLMKAGVEIDKLEEIYAHNQTELRRIQKEQEDMAIKRSSRFEDSLRQEVERRQKVVRHLAEFGLANVSAYELLDKPFLIWQSQGIDFPETHIEPANSSAKFNYFSDRSSGYQDLSFYFLWENPSDKFAVMNIDAYLVLNGFCSVVDGRSLFSGNRSSNLYMQTRLTIHEWWKQPPTFPLHQTDQLRHVLSLSANGGLLSGGDIDARHIFRGYDLRYNLFLMPPKGVAVFQVTLYFYYSTDEGAITVNFASGDFKVLCPGVLVAILT
jgi:hypothetical protein